MGKPFELAPAVRVASTPPAPPLDAVPLAVVPALFTCEPYRARLTKPACAARWVKVNGPNTRARPGAEATERAGLALQFSKCIGCDVGRAHAEECPPAPPSAHAAAHAKHARLAVVRRGAELAQEKTAPTSALKERKDDMGKAPVNITWNGKTQSISAWSRELKRSEAFIKRRHRDGLPLDAVLSSARKGGASAKTEKPAAASKPARKPRESRVLKSAAAIAPELAVEVLRMLGFDAVQLDAAVFGEGRFVFSARAL